MTTIRLSTRRMMLTALPLALLLLSFGLSGCSGNGSNSDLADAMGGHSESGAPQGATNDEEYESYHSSSDAGSGMVEPQVEPGTTDDETHDPDNTGDKYEAVGTNPFVITAAHPLSTFAADTDSASYDIFRRDIDDGYLPNPDSVRLEEYVNSFSYDYIAPEQDLEDPFRVQLEAAPSPFTPGAILLQVGIQGKHAPEKDIAGANLVFLIDTSGSMSSSNKLPLVKKLLSEAVGVLNPRDHLAIVTYAGSANVALESTSLTQDKTISGVISNLDAGGSTAGADGIQLAYEQAANGFIEGGINHVVLCSDGDFNVGPSSNEELIELIEEKRKSGITLTVLGFGSGNLNDSMMELLSNKGNGVYGVITNEDDAIDYAHTKLLSTIMFIAKDVKIQVEFNPAHNYAYRLLGYENRALEDWMFYEDKIDAGEISAGHSVTALYELIPTDGSIPHVVGAPEALDGPDFDEELEVADSELCLVKVRYKDIDASEEDPSMQVNTAIPAESILSDFSEANDSLRWAAAIAAFAEILKNSPYADETNLDTIRDTVEATKGLSADRQEFAAKLDIAIEMLSELNEAQ